MGIFTGLQQDRVWDGAGEQEEVGDGSFPFLSLLGGESSEPSTPCGLQQGHSWGTWGQLQGSRERKSYLLSRALVFNFTLL